MTAVAKYEKAKPCNLSKSAVEAVAEAAARKLGYKVGGDLESVIGRLGGKIEFLPFDGWIQHRQDTITVDGPQDFTIRLMRSDGPLRHRFTIAHELGHYILHSNQGARRIQVGRDGSNTRIEWEANWFAAAFLMPEGEFRKSAEVFGRDTLSLAGHFLVSEEAARVRLATLGFTGGGREG